MFSVMVLVVLSEFFLVAFPIKTLGQGNWNKSDYSEVFKAIGTSPTTQKCS